MRGFGAPPGVIPRSGADEEQDGDALEGAGPRSFRPDVLVAYDALSPAAWLGARTARHLKTALVLVENGELGSVAPAYRRGLKWVGEHLWGSYVRNTASHVVALDPIAQERAVEEGFDPDHVSTFPRGVDLGVFRPSLTSGLLSRHRIGGRVLLYIGRLETNRGVDTLVTAFAHTVGQRSDWSLVLAGEGSAKARLRALAHRLGVGTRVHILPRPRPEEQPGLMGASTLLAVPALDDTVYGKSINRAMACGLPVLASDLPRLRFLVESEETGLLAPPGDVVAGCGEVGSHSMKNGAPAIPGSVIPIVVHIKVSPSGKEREPEAGSDVT